MMLPIEKHLDSNLQPLPQFNCGGTLIDIADREVLYFAMEEGLGAIDTVDSASLPGNQ